MTNDDTPRRLKSVDRAFDIIEYLRTQGPSTLSTVAEAMNMPMSTTHIHLTTLVENGYVVKPDDEYECSLRFLQTGGELRDDLALFQAAEDEIDELTEELGEYANVVTMQDGYMVQLYKSRNRSSIDDNATLGSYLPLHATATGKAMLAYLPEKERLDTIDRRGLHTETEATITDRDELLEELTEVQERGYSINRNEHFEGVCAVAVPILVDSKELIGAISVSGPSSRIGDDRIENEISPALSDKRNIIELKIR